MKTMKILVSVTALFTVLFLTYGFVNVNNGNSNKITICHIPPGNPDNCHEISVSMNALQAHLDHGDALVCHDPNEIEIYTVIATAAAVSLIVAY